jgi:hypothetical protein
VNIDLKGEGFFSFLSFFSLFSFFSGDDLVVLELLLP